MSTATDERAPGMTLTLHNAPEGTVLAFGSPTYPCHARRRAGRWWVAAGTKSETSVPLHACDVIDVVFVPGPPVRWERSEDGRPDLAGEPMSHNEHERPPASVIRRISDMPRPSRSDVLADHPACACPGICYRHRTLGTIGRPAPSPGAADPPLD